MTNWRSLLRSDPTEWLLEESNPSVRYFTLTRILDFDETNKEVRRARQDIMQAGAVPVILAKQEPAGNWDPARNFYTSKYRGTVWQLIILAEHAADPEDERVRRACEFILEHSQDRSTGGFAYHRAERTGGGRPSEVIPCLTGNMVWSLQRLGYAEDQRVQHGVDWLSEYLRFDDGESRPPRGWRYRHFENCYGRHSCFMGVVKGLKALADVPQADRSTKVENCIGAAVDFLLKHHLYKNSHDPARTAKVGWTRLGFPKMWQTDVLEILRILTGLGIREERMQEAVDLIAAKQDDRGRWMLQDTFNDRTQVRIEQKGKPSKWVTLHALSVLKGFYEQARL
jgi:hypothetical protein